MGLFITGATKVEGRTKNSPYELIDTVLIDVAKKGALDEILDRSIDRRTQSTLSMDAFTSSALAS